MARPIFALTIILAASATASADSLDTNLVLRIEGTLTKEIRNSHLEVGIRVKNISEVNYAFVEVECTGLQSGNAIIQNTGGVNRVKRFSTAFGQVNLWHEGKPPPRDVQCRILNAYEGEP